MARTQKQGLGYFPLDVDFFEDIKIRKLIKYQGCKSISVYALLLCNIYKNGYYMRWDEELPFIISEKTGYDEAYILEVIKCCASIGLFEKNLFDEGVITSRGIQERYQTICTMARKKFDISEYNLLSCVKADKCTIIDNKCTRIADKCAKSTQRKENKSKVNKIEEKSIKKKDELSFSLSENNSENTEKLYLENQNNTTIPLPPSTGKKTEKRFLSPTEDEVATYIAEQGYTVNARAFVAFYTSKDWYVGKNKMKDWHAALVTWNTRKASYNAPQNAPQSKIAQQMQNLAEALKE
ncbi:MAG: DUF4373 domain-containing protein [Flavobacteriales bacterium]|nr:DUF4373 domain-containing protein [Flavobacteriales bacterium]